jgi:hypothetical protein
MIPIENAIAVLQGCLDHPGADDAITGLRAMLDQQPVAHLLCGGLWGDELNGWEIDPEHAECDRLNEAAHQGGQELRVPLYPAPQHTPATAQEPTVTVRYDLSAANTESAIRSKLIELGWQPPAPQREPLTNEQIVEALEAHGVEFQRFKGGFDGQKDCWSTAGSQSAPKLCNGIRAIVSTSSGGGAV